NRIWRIYIDENGGLNPQIKAEGSSDNFEKVFHKTVKILGEHIERARFNTAISQMMVFINECYKDKVLNASMMRDFIKILSVFAPHLAEELWERTGNKTVLTYEPWPEYDPELVKDEVIEYPVQINGKVRFKLEADAEADEDSIRALVLEHERLAQYTEGKSIVKIIIVPKRIITLVVE
ncbi:MAG: class I tRNA ligase family protein, partial [FCB group bacterium]|nr:class I tRNA ligase family protein [FCB group bacterium]